MDFVVDSRPRKRNRWDNELSSQEDPSFHEKVVCLGGCETELEEGEVSPA